MFSPNQQKPIARTRERKPAVQRDMAGHGQLLSVQVPSPTNYGGQNQNGSPSPYVGNPMDPFSQAESLVSSSKKLENELLMLGQNIKDHEEKIEYLNTHISSLDDQIIDIQVTLGKSHSSNTQITLTEEKDLSEDIMQQHPKSAAAIVCHFKNHQGTHDDPSCIKDVLGVVATLGKVYDDNLGRLLSEYLGVDTMLALVCMTYDDVKALEGSINKINIEGRFNVICLEKLRPYVGEFMADDPQSRLALVKPKFPDGKSPTGFLGFAVNMIHIDSPHLKSKESHGLRETLFYNLFSRLQVYRNREDMVHALPCISHGAVSLDGGMIRSNGVFVLGKREEMDVRFAVSSYVPEKLVEIEKKMKELKWERETMVETLQIEEPILANIRYTFEFKKQYFGRFMAQSTPYTMQYPIPATPRRSTPR